jgi:hypothetical protein
MTFGRMNNMRRRSSRADESFHRNRRRSNVDRSAMLMGDRRRRSPLTRLFTAILGIFSRR